MSCSFVIAVTGCQFPEKDETRRKIEKREEALQEEMVPDTVSQEDKPDSIVEYDMSELEERLIAAGLVNIREKEPSIQVDLRYSTENNFLGKDVYEDFDQGYLQPDVAEKLALAQLFLRSKYPAYSLVIFDAVRPRSVQWKMWHILDMPAHEKTKYVSNPRNGSLHNFGAAVDVSIADEYGELLDMGTEYDYFGEEAYPRLEQKMLKEGKLTQKQLDNRELLREVMKNAGFSPITTEWWHFNSCSRKEAYRLYEIVE